jgi:hypothetical protein
MVVVVVVARELTQRLREEKAVLVAAVLVDRLTAGVYLELPTQAVAVVELDKTQVQAVTAVQES